MMNNAVRNLTIYLLLLFGILSSSSLLALDVFIDRTTFTAANPGLVTEDFETNRLAGRTSIQCSAPLNASTSNACFLPGDLMAGVEFDLPDNPNGTTLALYGPVDPATTRIGANSISDFLVAHFADADITAVGLDLVCTFSNKAGTVRFYGNKGLITEESVQCTAAGNFIGIASEEVITRVEAQAPGTWEAVDNVTFGSATLFTAYTDREVFEATYPLLTKEDFEAGDLGGSGAVACPSPLSSSSDNNCFKPGGLAPGVEYKVQDSPLIPQLALSGPLGGRSNSLGANGFSDYLIASFSSPRTAAVGLGVYCLTGPGQASVRFYSPNGLITEQTFACSATITFIGIAANIWITHIEVEQVGENEYIDDLLFGKSATQLVFKDDFE